MASLRGLTPPFSIPATPREAVGARGVPPPAPLGSQETGVPPTGLPWEFGDSYLGGGGAPRSCRLLLRSRDEPGRRFFLAKGQTKSRRISVPSSPPSTPDERKNPPRGPGGGSQGVRGGPFSAGEGGPWPVSTARPNLLGGWGCANLEKEMQIVLTSSERGVWVAKRLLEKGVAPSPCPSASSRRRGCSRKPPGKGNPGLFP